MKPRIALLINGVCALLLGWLYGGDALDALRAQSAEVSAYLEPPNLVFALGALLATAVGFGATVLGVAQKKVPAWRGFRLMPIVTVVVLFVDLFLFTAAKSPLSSSDRTALTIQSLAEAATNAGTPSSVPTGPREVQVLAEQFGAPPYLLNGQPVKAWSVVVRKGCAGPVTEVQGEGVGTLFYCVAADGKQAWVSAVGLPVGTYFGRPQLFTRGGEPVVGVSVVKAEEEPQTGAAEEESPEMGQTDPGPTPPWLQTPDSGR